MNSVVCAVWPEDSVHSRHGEQMRASVVAYSVRVCA
jgi:hypothetical protein